VEPVCLEVGTAGHRLPQQGARVYSLGCR
jgi:hypothetical protein